MRRNIISLNICKTSFTNKTKKQSIRINFISILQANVFQLNRHGCTQSYVQQSLSICHWKPTEHILQILSIHNANTSKCLKQNISYLDIFAFRWVNF